MNTLALLAGAALGLWQTDRGKRAVHVLRDRPIAYRIHVDRGTIVITQPHTRIDTTAITNSDCGIWVVPITAGRGSIVTSTSFKPRVARGETMATEYAECTECLNDGPHVVMDGGKLECGSCFALFDNPFGDDA